MPAVGGRKKNSALGFSRLSILATATSSPVESPPNRYESRRKAVNASHDSLRFFEIPNFGSLFTRLVNAGEFIHSCSIFFCPALWGTSLQSNTSNVGRIATNDLTPKISFLEYSIHTALVVGLIIKTNPHEHLRQGQTCSPHHPPRLLLGWSGILPTAHLPPLKLC